MIYRVTLGLALGCALFLSIGCAKTGSSGTEHPAGDTAANLAPATEQATTPATSTPPPPDLDLPAPKPSGWAAYDSFYEQIDKIYRAIATNGGAPGKENVAELQKRAMRLLEEKGPEFSESQPMREALMTHVGQYSAISQQSAPPAMGVRMLLPIYSLTMDIAGTLGSAGEGHRTNISRMLEGLGNLAAGLEQRPR